MSIINFNLSLFGDITQRTSTLSHARVRIFYTGINRNSIYISEEFAQKLLSTLSYAPIKGIYEESANDKDFTDHGKARSQGRVYGVIPENPNISWENHMDEDGVTRTYACADALLFTALYPEAAEIAGKAQSMELYAQSIVGSWEIIESQRVFVYKDGRFLGLQVLGKKVEPCFEGAEFFTLYANLKNLIDNLGGKQTMTLNFKLSDKQDFEKLFYLINNRCTEEFDWEVGYAICDIYDTYTMCYDYNSKEFFHQMYQKDDAGDIILGDRINSIILEVSTEELQALNALKVANNNNFVEVDKVYTAASLKISELETENAATRTDYDNVVLHCAQQKEEILALTSTNKLQTEELERYKQAIAIDVATLTTELEQLKTFKAEKIKQERDLIVERYSKILDEEVIKTTDNIEGIVELEKELAYIACQRIPNIFTSKGTEDPHYIPDLVSGTAKSDVTQLLIKNKKKN